MENKFLLLDDSEGIHFLILFEEYINVNDFLNKISKFKKENVEWYYEDIERFIKSNYKVKKYYIFEECINCKKILEI